MEKLHCMRSYCCEAPSHEMGVGAVYRDAAQFHLAAQQYKAKPLVEVHFVGLDMLTQCRWSRTNRTETMN